jgi:hypothetical protein
MQLKLVKDWKLKYLGLNINNTVYYFAWRPASCSRWGYMEDWHDGPMYEFSLGRLAFIWHWDKIR